MDPISVHDFYFRFRLRNLKLLQTDHAVCYINRKFPMTYTFDASTYILTVHGNSQKLKNYPRLLEDLTQFMKNFTEDLLTCFPDGLSWNPGDFSSNGSVSTMKMLLRITRNDDFEVGEEVANHQLLQKLIKERKFISKAWRDTKLTLKSADVCFHHVIKTSFGDLTWYNSLLTKTAISEPMCLNGWKLMTRECKSSTITGAKWQKFDYSLCSNYQAAVKNAEINCPDGFRQLKPNLCYSVHKSHTYEEANEICQNSSSYLMNSKILSEYIFSLPGLSVKMKARYHFNRDHTYNETYNFCYNSSSFKRNSKKQMKNMFSVLDLPAKFWISGKFAYLNVHYIGKSVLLNILKLPQMNGIKSSIHCASVTWTPYSFKISVENCRKKNNFVCIYQPIKLVRSSKLSHAWNRLSTQSVCYNFVNERVDWSEANNTCQSFSGEARLLQSIQLLHDYSLFKNFVRTSVMETDKAQSWWIGLVQDKNSFKWLSFPVQFVDWSSHTYFSRKRSAGVLTFDKDNGEMRWTLRDPSSKTAFICEMQDCTDSRPTLTYIEDRTLDSAMVKSYSAALNDFKLRCVMSGWYVSNSISWLKDGIPISTNTNFDNFGFLIKPETTNLADILPFQGYYWCSVNQAQFPHSPIQSSKVLFRIPGLHTFVLHMHSTDLFVEVSECSDYIDNFLLPPEFVEHLNQTIHGFEIAFLRNLTCERFAIHYYIHILVQKNAELEGKVLKTVENSVISSFETMGTLLEDLQIDKNYLFIRSTTACQGENIVFHNYSTTWPATLMGQSVQSNELCVGDDGKVIERKCLGDFNTGVFWGPILKECANVSSYITVTLYKLSKINITKDNIFEISLKMELLISSFENLTSADVQYVALILRNWAIVPTIQPKVFSSFISTVDQLISAKLSTIVDKDHSNVSNMISFAMESIPPHLETNGQLFKTAGSNIAVSVFPHRDNMTRIQTGGILKNWNSNLTTIFNGTGGKDLYSVFDTFEAGVLLPENLVAEIQNEFRDHFSIVIHKNIYPVRDISVVSPVICVSIGRRNVFDLEPPIEMIFKVPQVEKHSSYLCVFWDHNLNDNFGGWSYKGCISQYLDSTHILCSCDHLTSFAVILEHGHGLKISDVHQITLSYISYIGCAMSIFGLGIVILTFVLFRQWRKDLKHKALFNLSLSLFSFLVIFVTGLEDKWGSEYGCMAVAALLHFFMLASFSWMVVEAFMHYLRLVKVIGTYIPGFMQKAVLFAWGGPLLIVGTILGIDYNLYNSKNNYCWVSEKVFHYAVAGPVLTMLAVNFVIFTLILYSSTCGRTKKLLRTNQDERKEMITCAKAVFCVSILLGLSWMFGFLAVDEAKVMFQYLFSVTTTLQGFLIFVFFVCRQKNARNLWLNLITPTTSEMFITSSTDGAGRSVKANNEQNQLDKVGFRARLPRVTADDGL